MLGQRNHQLTEKLGSPLHPLLLRLCHHPFGINNPSHGPSDTFKTSSWAPSPQTASNRAFFSSPSIISDPRIRDALSPEPIRAIAESNSRLPRRGGSSRTSFLF